MDNKAKVFGQTVELQLEVEEAEANIRRLMRKIARAHRDNGKHQEDCQKVGDTIGYQEAVAEEAAINGAYQRLETAVGRMHYGGS